MDLSPAFFDLQLRFADSIVRVSHLSFEEALLNFTNLYVQFIGRSFNPAHPVRRPPSLTDLFVVFSLPLEVAFCFLFGL
ncbi:hypothetical protein KSZ_51390 [Dictyobacter formicarum]|uniref:Uncharacterized protein n=1 Tax=Dictyobacter formicarum TaxID=2778368 RepID=A0ABQ3VMU3_9CHLR|nr:hypothetical protein KSZ_51390 [Dictyobacter formicarum]